MRNPYVDVSYVQVWWELNWINKFTLLFDSASYFFPDLPLSPCVISLYNLMCVSLRTLGKMWFLGSMVNCRWCLMKATYSPCQATKEILVLVMFVSKSIVLPSTTMVRYLLVTYESIISSCRWTSVLYYCMYSINHNLWITLKEQKQFADSVRTRNVRNWGRDGSFCLCVLVWRHWYCCSVQLNTVKALASEVD